MCDGETSAKRMCDGETSTKEYEMAKHQKKEYVTVKHQLKDGNITWQRWRNFKLTRFKTEPKGTQTIKIGLYFFTLKKDLSLLEIFYDFPRKSFSFKMQYAKGRIIN